MTRRPSSQPLHGIIPPMVTPLREPDALDEEGLERLIEHILGGGVHGLSFLASRNLLCVLCLRFFSLRCLVLPVQSLLHITCAPRTHQSAPARRSTLHRGLGMVPCATIAKELS